MNLDDVKKLITLLEKSKLKKLNFKKDNIEISLEKEDVFYQKNIKIANPIPQTVDNKTLHQEKEDNVVATNSLFITSPMVGTFFNSPAPDKPSFVKVGDIVEKDTIVCIVEAMKVMNEVKANQKGKIEEILHDNQDPVEYGSKLFSIIPL